MLFETLFLNQTERLLKLYWLPKQGMILESSILNKCISQTQKFLNLQMQRTDHKIYYRTTGGLYWKVFTDFQPEFFLNGKAGSSSRETHLSLSRKSYQKPGICLLSSNLFWWWYTMSSNLRDLNPSDIEGFPINENLLADKRLNILGENLMNDFKRNSSLLVREQARTGTTETQSFKISLSKHIIDEIDKVLAEHYGFSEEELDFIINYDIKYRMGLGKAGAVEEEEE
jgi:hypothetical protein